jgi:meiotic recombination protein DMC1
MTKHLEKIKGFSEVKITKVKDAVRKCLVCRLTSWFLAIQDLKTDKILSMKPSQTPFISGIEVLAIRKRVVKISTGSKQLDKILGG